MRYRSKFFETDEGLSVISSHLLSICGHLQMNSSQDREHGVTKPKVQEQLHALQQEDEQLYDMVAIDIWALAKTMDEFQPGFWGAFMKNRKKTLKRFLNQMAKSKLSNVKRPPFLR